MILSATPFYGESGGQVGDTGAIASPQGRVVIEDTRHPIAGITAHHGRVQEGCIAVGDTVQATVDVERRLDIARNHTATHLLHQALKQVLGNHAQQAGSLVTPQRLRFDFTHLSATTRQELDQVQALVNAHIRDNLPLQAQIMGYQEALQEGTTALFGEKYGDVVRRVRIGEYSAELCGGTHLGATGQIGSLIILSEASIGSGLRRIEALTGRGAEEHINKQLRLLEGVVAALDARPTDVLQKAEALLDTLRAREDEIQELRRKLAQQDAEQLLSQAQEINGARVLTAVVEAASMDDLRGMTDLFRDRLGSAAVVLGAVIDEKPALVAAATPDLIARGINAIELVRAAAKVVGGGGGGRPHLAQAGGRDASKLEEALDKVPGLVKAALQGA